MARIGAWLLAYVVPSCILLGGAFGLWTSGGYLVDAFRSKHWEQTRGMVTRSELESETRFLSSNHDRTQYWPAVEYQYSVDGIDYTSHNVTLDGLRSGAHVGDGKAEAEEVLSRYPLNSKVTVYYDPNEPANATLQPGASKNNLFVPIFSVVLIALGAYWLRSMLCAETGDDENWAGRERDCPKCGTTFTSVQDKGSCPACQYTFYASKSESLN